MTVRTYRDLEAWQRAMNMVEQCYKATKNFPREGTVRFDWSASARGRVSSVECRGRLVAATGAFINHVSIALGSLAEVETCVEIALRLGYLPT
jgi:four helix bundle protein